MPNSSRTAVQIFLLIALIGTPLAAEAYVGPGAGLSLLSALWGLVCAIGAAFLFVIMWPIRRLRRLRAEKRRAKEDSDDSATQPSSAGQPQARKSSAERSPDNDHRAS